MFKIDKPTLGRVVHFTDNEGLLRLGFVQQFHEGSTNGGINLHYLNADKLTLATSVPHNADGAKYSWRYPPRTEEKIDVAH